MGISLFSLFLICLLAIPNTASASRSGLYNGAFIAHHPPGLHYSNGSDWYQRYNDEFALTDFAQQHNRIDLDGNKEASSVWYIIAAFSDETSICGVQFGFGDYDPGIYKFAEWGRLPKHGSLEIPTPGWPGPNSGTALAASDGSGWRGQFIPIYYFSGYAYAEGVIPLSENPQTRDGGIGTCSAPPLTIEAEQFGAMGIFTDGKAVTATLPVLAYDDFITPFHNKVIDGYYTPAAEMGRDRQRPDPVIDEIPTAEFSRDPIEIPELTGHRILDLTIDRTGTLYILSSARVKDDGSPNRSYPSLRICLHRYDTPVATLFEVDGDYSGGKKIAFDRDNTMWLLCSDSIKKRSNDDSPLMETLNISGASCRTFIDIDFDYNNNIWASPRYDGLYKITGDGAVTHYTPANSPLASMAVRNIVCLANGEVWVTFRHGTSINVIRGDDWETHAVYSGDTRYDAIEPVVSDGNGTIWAGAQTFSGNPPLFQYDGNTWLPHSIPHLANYAHPILVKHLLPLGDKLWVATQLLNSRQHITCVDAFDGENWQQVPQLPHTLTDLRIVADPEGSAIWVFWKEGDTFNLIRYYI